MAPLPRGTQLQTLHGVHHDLKIPSVSWKFFSPGDTLALFLLFSGTVAAMDLDLWNAWQTRGPLPREFRISFCVLEWGPHLTVWKQHIAQFQEWDGWVRGQVHTEFHKETDNFPQWLYQFVVPFVTPCQCLSHPSFCWHSDGSEWFPLQIFPKLDYRWHWALFIYSQSVLVMHLCLRQLMI